MGPAPPEGRHRYIYMLWRQTPAGQLDEIAKEDMDHTIEVRQQRCASSSR
jgi:phosphatidylethanolamine-binding protein (PEBP) family uncharacterized protein